MFIENQTVWCAMFGKGVVARISLKGAKFPVVVNFGGLMERCYSLEGKYEQLYATQPTLFPYPIEIVKKITKPSINWDHVRSEFKYLAQDEDAEKAKDAEPENQEEVQPPINAARMDSLQQQSEAWNAICEVLFEVSPYWCDGTDSAIDQAVAAIRAMAKAR